MTVSPGQRRIKRVCQWFCNNVPFLQSLIDCQAGPSGAGTSGALRPHWALLETALQQVKTANGDAWSANTI
ncbi:MAG: hypothetical protein ACE5GZ_08430 [Gammaproteobacteria bacterium]